MGLCYAKSKRERGTDFVDEPTPDNKTGGPPPSQPEYPLSEKESEYAALVAMTNFDAEDIAILREKFETVSNTKIKDGKIHRVEFLAVLGQDTRNEGKDAPLIYHRVFEKFDYKKNNTIDFQEFVCGLSHFAEKASLEEKIAFAFKLFDLVGDDKIHKDEVKQILRPSLQNAGLEFTDEQIDRIVASTFEETGGDTISYSQFFEMCHQNPMAMSMFTIPFITEREKSG